MLFFPRVFFGCFFVLLGAFLREKHPRRGKAPTKKKSTQGALAPSLGAKAALSVAGWLSMDCSASSGGLGLGEAIKVVPWLGPGGLPALAPCPLPVLLPPRRAAMAGAFLRVPF